MKLVAPSRRRWLSRPLETLASSYRYISTTVVTTETMFRVGPCSCDDGSSNRNGAYVSSVGVGVWIDSFLGRRGRDSRNPR